VVAGAIIGTAVYAVWNTAVNVRAGRPWYENLGIEASKGLIVGGSLGLVGPVVPLASPAIQSALVSVTPAATNVARGPFFTPSETHSLTKLFGRSVAGADALLSKLRSGERVQLPEGVTREVLLRYRDIAQRAVDADIDNLGVQARRLEAINRILDVLAKEVKQ
jgi:hypothetical protein